MKFREVFRLEVGYQIRRPWMWAYLVAIFGLILRITTEAYTANARIDGYFFNAPFVSASMALIASLMGLLVAAGIAGDAAARDVQLRMHPLLYTAPLTTRTFLAGRFLAAFSLTALVLKEDGEKILEAGCNAHMTKPIKRQTLLEVLQACEGYRPE